MVDTLCDNSSQFSTEQFETLQTFLSWSVDVHAFWYYCQFNVCYFFSTFELSHFGGLNTVDSRYLDLAYLE